MEKTLLSTKTKRFPGGVTTAYILGEGADHTTYGVTVVTRFDSGNYLTEHELTGLTPAKALEFATVYTR